MDHTNRDGADPPMPDADADVPRRTRIQRRNRETIMEAALDVFSQHGFRGATVDLLRFPTSTSVHADPLWVDSPY